MPRYQLMDMSGALIALVGGERGEIREGDMIDLPDGSPSTVIAVLDDGCGLDAEMDVVLVVERVERLLSQTPRATETRRA